MSETRVYVTGSFPVRAWTCLNAVEVDFNAEDRNRTREELCR